MTKGKKSKNKFIGEIQKDFSRKNFIEGGLIRPTLLMLAFFAFIGAIFLILTKDLKWGGSLIIFSFIINIYTIFESLKDKESIFRTLNLIFKLVLFGIEIVIFNYILILI